VSPAGVNQAIEGAPVSRLQKLRSPGTVLARFVGKSISKTSVIIGYVFAAYAAASIQGYARTYKTPASRETMARLFGTNPGFRALFGDARGINTVAGFTAWRTIAVLTIVGGIWGLMAATKRFRGEEEAGRSEYFLSGHVTGGLAALNTLAGLGVGLLVIYFLVALVTYIAGNMGEVHFTFSATLFYALVLTSGVAVFMAVGALASQIAPTRRRAAGLAAGVFGVSFLLRAIGDATPKVSWLGHLSPLGWIHQLKPLTGSDPVWLVPVIAFIAVLCGLTVYIAERRDMGASLVPDKDAARPRLRLLGGTLGLAVRETRGALVGWLLAIAAVGMIMGAIAKAAGEAMASASVGTFWNDVTRTKTIGTTTYLGIVFMMFMLLIVLMAASYVNAMREDEAEGYLDNLLTAPVSRMRWLGGRLLVLVVSVLLAGAVSGLFAWFGTASQRAGIGLNKMMQAGINSALPAAVIIGLGILTLGFKPRWTSAVMYAVIGWSFLLQLIGPAIKLNHWVLDTSLFYHVALVPAVDPRWGTNAMLVGIGVVTAIIGAVAFNMRDLAGQ
jgi:polyether ionophore transport system permease protein